MKMIDVDMSWLDDDSVIHPRIDQFEAPDSLDQFLFGLYMNNLTAKKKLNGYSIKFLLEALTRAEANGYDINDLVLVAALAGKRQVIYEHHLNKQQPA